MTTDNPFALWDSATLKVRPKVDEAQITQIEVKDEIKQETQDTSSAAPQEKEIEETTLTSEDPETPNEDEDHKGNLKESKSTSDEDESWKKRYSDLRSHLNDKANEIKDLKNKLKELEAKPDISKLASEEDLEAFEKDNPEVYTLFKTLAVKTNKELEEQLKELKEQQAQVAQERAFNEVLKVHPDADEIRHSDKFKEWYKEQTRAIQALISSDSAIDAIKGLNLYKEEQGISSKATVTKKQEKAQAAQAVKGSAPKASPSDTKKIWKESEIEKLSSSEFSKLKAEINKAKLEGRLVYDISG